MRRNYSSIRGAGFGRAFQEAAVATPGERQPIEATPTAPRAKVCDRSADIGTTHYWRDDANHGDLCLCGKRSKVVLEPCAVCKVTYPLHRLFEMWKLTAKQTHSSPAEYDPVLVCRACLDTPDPDFDYERAQASEAWQRRGGGEL